MLIRSLFYGSLYRMAGKPGHFWDNQDIP